MAKTGPTDRSESIFDVCQALHSSASGSSDPLPDDELRRLTAWLQMRVDEWHRTAGRSVPWEEFDDAVYLLCRAALRDAQRDLEWRRQPEKTDAAPVQGA